MSNIISTNNVCKSYKAVMAVNNVSISVPRGSICGLVGKNGAGKTTLLRILCGLIPDYTGSYVVDADHSTTAISGIIENPALHLSMTALDNLIMQSKLLGLKVEKPRLNSLLQLVGLDNIANKQAKHLSLGMKQRLAIAMSLVGNPQVLILDEPTNGLDPQGIHAMRQLFVKLNEQLGVTILISSHILSELAKFATHYIFMDGGQVIKCIDNSQLEQVRSSSTQIVTSDNARAIEILTASGYEGMNIVGDSIVISGKQEGTALIILLANNDIRVSSMSSTGDSLEDYFLSIIGGGR